VFGALPGSSSTNQDTDVQGDTQTGILWTVVLFQVDFVNGIGSVTVNGGTTISDSFSGTQKGTFPDDSVAQWIINYDQIDASVGKFQLGELILGPGSLTQSQIDSAFGYLSHKWSLEGNLPTEHPYKSAAPSSNPFDY
jgi:hypothetical protein